MTLRKSPALRIAAFVGALGLSVGMLAACSSDSGSGEPSSDTTTEGGDGAVEPADTLTLTSGYAAGDVTGNFLDAVVESFTAETGIKVEVLPVAWDDLTDVLEADTVAGQASDLYTLNFTDLVKPFLDDEAIVDTTPYLDAWGIAEKLQPGAADSWGYNGKTGGFPYGAFYWPVWWNTAILDEAGVDGVPQTADELFAANDKIRAAGYQTLAIDGADWGGAGLTWMMSQSYIPADEIQTLMGKGGFAASENAIKAFDYIGELRDKKVFVDNAEGYSNAEVQTQFFEGQIAAAHLGSWAFTQAVDAGMDISTIELGGFPVPSDGAYDKPLALRGGGNGWLLTKSAADDPARLAAVEAFIKYLYEPEQLQLWVGPSSQFSPATSEAIGDAEPENALNKDATANLPNKVEFAQLHDLFVKPGVDITAELSWYLGTDGAKGEDLAQRFDALYQG